LHLNSLVFTQQRSAKDRQFLWIISYKILFSKRKRHHITGNKMITETPPRLEPCLPESLEPEIVDLIAALSTAAERLGNQLHPKTAASLADLVRVMNCFYSNLIEGHNTMPRDIDRALQNLFDSNGEWRPSQFLKWCC
jgi:hypothetical protein